MKKNIIITGATSGIGFQTALQLAQMGHQVIITGRSEKNALSAVEQIKQESGNQQVSYILSDLSTIKGMEALIDGIKSSGTEIDVFINNVGGLFADRKETEDGLERHLAINHIIPVLLLNRLKPLFRKDGNSRYVFLTTSGHRFGKPDFLDYQSKGRFYGLSVYNKAKSYNLLYNFSQAEDFRKDGISIIAADPGGAKTEMTSQIDARFVPPIMKPMMGLMKIFGVFGDVEKAAKSAVYAATSSDIQGKTGIYISPGPKKGKASGYIYNDKYQQASLEMTSKIIRDFED